VRRRAPLWVLLTLVFVVQGCRPTAPAGLPRDPGQALHALSALDHPERFSLTGRLRTAIAGVELDLGLVLLVDGDAARLEIDLPFGGRAMTVVLGEDGSVLCTTIGSELAFYSEDGGELARVLLGDWADARALVDILTGRLPASFDGDVTWHRRGRRSLLSLALPGGRTALCDVHRRPTRLREMLLMGEDESLQGHATWNDWSETDGYWFPENIRLTASQRLGNLHVIIRRIDLDPSLSAGAFDTTPPEAGHQPFDELLQGMQRD
jgi:hypothetical protein